MFDSIALFEALEAPTEESQSSRLLFATVPIPKWPTYHLGRTVNGEPALLIETRKGAAQVPPPLRLQSLAVYHDATCRLWSRDKGFEERVYTVLWSTSSDPLIRRYFLQLLTPLVIALGKSPTSERVFETVDGLAELFRALGRPPRRSTQGLWAELLLISIALDPIAVARVWHRDPNERFDFNAGDQRVEVKSASGTRKHHFSLSQLDSPPGVRIVIASLIAVRATGGLSVESVLNRVQARIAADPELQSRVYRVIAETLGASLPVALNEAFDEQTACESLRYFKADDIPTVGRPLPPAVSDVRFVADLSSVGAIEPERLRGSGGLFQALVAVSGSYNSLAEF
ncbi:MAG: PD-(D/E)XK motif protein [Gemmatimonadaceae bacterium]